jgi:hypothetical protein
MPEITIHPKFITSDDGNGKELDDVEITVNGVELRPGWWTDNELLRAAETVANRVWDHLEPK